MTVYINGTTGYSGPVGTIGDLTTTGNTTLGDASTDKTTINGKLWSYVDGTTTQQYLSFGDGTTTYSSVGGYRDSSTTGHLEFYTLNAGTLTEGMRLDASGNLGLGVTPSAWTTYTNVLQTPGLALATNGTAAVLGANWYYDGQNRYKTNGYSTLYIQSAGAHSWFTAASGTAGNTLSSLNQAMTLDASGNLGLGTSSPSTYAGANGQLVVYGGVNTTFTNNPNNITLVNNGTIAAGLGAGINFCANYNGSSVTTYALISGIRENATSGSPAGALVFGTRDSSGTTTTERARIDSSGNFYLGATGSARGGSTTRQLVKLGAGQSYLEIQSASTSSTSDAVLFSDGSSGNYGIVGYDHSNDALNFFTAAAERARITSIGNFLLGTSSATTQPSIFVQYNNSCYIATVTYQINVATGTTQTITLNLSTLNISNNYYYSAEVTAGVYGNASTGPGVYKGILAGYSGGASYQTKADIVNSITNGSFTLSGGTNTISLAIYNTGGYEKLGVVRFNIQWS